MGVGWPVGSEQPFLVRNDYSWKEIGSIFRVMDEFHVGFVIETGVQEGDLAAWMMSKCLFDTDFQYIGICLQIECVRPVIRHALEKTPQAFIRPGLSYADVTLKFLKRMIHNSFKPVMVICDGLNLSKEFMAYAEILRPGDVLLVSGFPALFTMSTFKQSVDEEKMKRIGQSYMNDTKLIGGVLI